MQSLCLDRSSNSFSRLRAAQTGSALCSTPEGSRQPWDPCCSSQARMSGSSAGSSSCHCPTASAPPLWLTPADPSVTHLDVCAQQICQPWWKLVCIGNLVDNPGRWKDGPSLSVDNVGRLKSALGTCMAVLNSGPERIADVKCAR